jgi:hypothetical protein
MPRRQVDENLVLGRKKGKQELGGNPAPGTDLRGESGFLCLGCKVHFVETETTATKSPDSASGCVSKGFESRHSYRYCLPLLIAALFTIAKRWKQLRCPLLDEWINNVP